MLGADWSLAYVGVDEAGAVDITKARAAANRAAVKPAGRVEARMLLHRMTDVSMKNRSKRMLMCFLGKGEGRRKNGGKCRHANMYPNGYIHHSCSCTKLRKDTYMVHVLR